MVEFRSNVKEAVRAYSKKELETLDDLLKKMRHIMKKEMFEILKITISNRSIQEYLEHCTKTATFPVFG